MVLDHVSSLLLNHTCAFGQRGEQRRGDSHPLPGSLGSVFHLWLWILLLWLDKVRQEEHLFTIL